MPFGRLDTLAVRLANCASLAAAPNNAEEPSTFGASCNKLTGSTGNGSWLRAWLRSKLSDTLGAAASSLDDSSNIMFPYRNCFKMQTVPSGDGLISKFDMYVYFKCTEKAAT